MTRFLSAGVFAAAALWANLACVALVREMGSPETVRLAALAALLAAAFGALAFVLPDRETRRARKAVGFCLGLLAAGALGAWNGGSSLLSTPGALLPTAPAAEQLEDVKPVGRGTRRTARSLRRQAIEVGGELSAREQTRRIAARPGTPFRGRAPAYAERIMFGVAAETDAPASGRVVARRVEDGEILLSQQVETNGRASGWQDVTLDLVDTPVQLEIRLEEGAGALSVSEPVFLRSTAEDRPQNLILISLDTVRADMLGAYGYERWPTSPHFDSLATRGTLFEDHISASPWTKPSHLAMLTGVTPEALGMGELMGATPRLPKQRATLAELFRNDGYLSVAFTGTATMSAFHGYADGFYLYQEAYNDAELVMRDFDTNAYLALEWLAEAPPAPKFLFFHSFEPHDPYVHRRFVSPEVSSEDFHLAAYASGLAFTDAALEKLLDDLGELGLLENSIVIITSDHGDGFDVPPRRYHGKTLFDDVVRPPLLIFGEGIPEGRRVKAQVPSVDLLATVAELFDLPLPPDTDSQSLLPLIRGESEEPRDAYLCCLAHKRQMVGIRSDGFKYILTLKKDGRRREQLFDLTADPMERVDVSASYGGVTAKLRAKLLAALERNRSRAEKDPGELLEFDARMRRQLEALGYIE